MVSKIKISKSASDSLKTLERRLNLKRNILCRLAVGLSLNSETSVADYKVSDSTGYEFNRSTLTGDYDDIFLALIKQHEGKNLSDSEYMTKYLRNHIERGIAKLSRDYEKINSPIDYLTSLFVYKEQMDLMG